MNNELETGAAVEKASSVLQAALNALEKGTSDEAETMISIALDYLDKLI